MCLQWSYPGEYNNHSVYSSSLLGSQKGEWDLLLRVGSPGCQPPHSLFRRKPADAHSVERGIGIGGTDLDLEIGQTISLKKYKKRKVCNFVVKGMVVPQSE